MRKVLVSDQIAQELRRRIAQGVYAAGAFMPPERQLAMEFGTSRSTVSSALRKLCDEGLIEQTVGRGTRVLTMAESGEFGLIGIVHLARPPYSRFSTLLLQGVQQTLSCLGQRYEMMPVPPRAEELTADAIAERYGSVIFVEAPQQRDVVLELKARRFPYVVANLELDMDVTCTFVDHHAATLSAVRLLAAMGHERIALVTQQRERLFYGQVVSGFCDGMGSVGLDADSAPIIETAPDTLTAYAQVRAFLESNDPPTAIVAGRDWLAQATCQALTDRGLRIGPDVSVVGFDDISWPQGRDFLTTFAEPMYELGAVAAGMLIERLVNSATGVDKRELDAPLILRRSAAPRFDAPPMTDALRVAMDILPTDK